MAEDIEAELQAMKTLVETLEPLKPEVRSRVIDYAFKVLGIEPPHDASRQSSAAMAQLPPLTQPPPTPMPTRHEQHPRGTGLIDIQSLKEAKDPKTATQMVAVVALRGEEVVVLLCGGDKGSESSDMATVKKLASELED